MNTRQKIVYFLYSRKSLVGSLLGLFGLLLFAVGLIGRFWLGIVIGLYLIGVLATPRDRQYELRFQAKFTAEEIEDELRQLVRHVRRNVSRDILHKVEHIQDSILEILPHIADINSADYDIYNIRQTALEYLPEMLENYVNLPKAFRTLHPVKEGKTAKTLLMEQLDLLDREMEEIVQDFYQNDTQKLVTHGRFLEEKFKDTEVWAEKS